MKILNLQIDDNFFPHFKAMLDSLVKDKKVTIIEKEDFYNNYPQSVIIGSVEEVKQKAFEAEERIKNGKGVSQEEYDKTMDKFFNEEVGIDR